MTVRVLIADDHPVFRYGLRSLLANDPEIEVAGEADNMADMLVEVGRLRPDLVLLDIHLPGPNGIEAAYELRRRHPEIKVLILTAFSDDNYLLGALRAGVHGFLLKNTAHHVLTSAIHQIHANQRLLAAEKVTAVLEEFERLSREQARDQSGLQDVELEILRHLANGTSYREMSDQLYLSEVTLKRKVQGILSKMGVTSRAQAVAKAIRHGLI